MTVYFYPRPLRGGRRAFFVLIRHEFQFLSTPSARRATTILSDSQPSPSLFLSTPSARRATAVRLDIIGTVGISIHALCEEGDAERSGAVRCPWSISIHALCEEGDPRLFSPLWDSFLFLSTPSARRATRGVHQAARPSAISIHALCEEGDLALYELLKLLSNFYPRPLRGGRPTTRARRGRTSHNFYPRPLRGGRPTKSRPQTNDHNFYPRPLRGGRPLASDEAKANARFLSTPSARRAT